METGKFYEKHGLYLLCLLLQDGLGDTIRVSLTEPPEEEIDPCQRLANLGAQAANLQIGVVMNFHFPYFPVTTYHIVNTSPYYLCFPLSIYLTLLDFVLFYQAPFEEKHRRYFDFQRRSGQLPLQKEVC